MFGYKQLVNQIKLKPECLVNLVPQASICHKSELPPQKVYHYPYEKRQWDLTNFFLDPLTKKKFNENTKVIQVEGNIHSGKNAFAKRLADELGMKYIPPVDLDSHYINEHGFDYRALNPLLPERLRMACDFEMYHENPTRLSAIHMQHNLFKLRLAQYIKAIRHIFNTGQGVVLVRSPFTERVFVEAAHNIGWLPMGYLRGDGVRFYDWKLRYDHVRNLCLAYLLKPHLTIYLETPVETCLERAKNSTNPMIRESKAIVPEFLEAIEEAYKDVVLPKQGLNGHVLSYDYQQEATNDELMDVVDDIKNLNFEYDFHDTMFQSWDSNDWKLWYPSQRRLYSSTSCLQFFKYLTLNYYDIAGMGDCITQEDIKLRDLLYECHIGTLGHFTAVQHDVRMTNSYIKAFFGFLNFEQLLDRQLRTDFA